MVWLFTQQTHVLFNADFKFMLVYLYDVVPVLKQHTLQSDLCNLKGLAQAKIIKKSVILFWVLNMTIWCKHVQRLELQIFKIFVLRILQLG